MKAKEIYKRFLLKLNKNDSNEGINILPSLFVLLFNSEAERWLGDALDKTSDNSNLTELEFLLENEIKLQEFKKTHDWVEFELPIGFYRNSSSFAIVDKGECKNKKIIYFEKKPLGFSSLLADDFSKSSFDFEESLFIVNGGKVKAYIDEYIIKDFKMSYYRVPNKIDIAGYTRIDGSPSEDIDFESNDIHVVDEILNRLILEIMREYENAEGFQYAKDRVNTEP